MTTEAWLTWGFLFFVCAITLFWTVSIGIGIRELRESLFALRLDVERFVRGENYEDAQELPRKVPLLDSEGNPTAEYERRSDVVKERLDELDL